LDADHPANGGLIASRSTFQAAHGVVERLQRTGHAQGDEGRADAVQRGGAHEVAPSCMEAAKRWPTAS
jgi:hypothetical protein